jgi:hypothetical protein
MIGALAIVAFLFGWIFGGRLYQFGRRLFLQDPAPSPTIQPAPEQSPVYTPQPPNVGPTVGPSPTGSEQPLTIPPLSPRARPQATKAPDGSKPARGDKAREAVNHITDKTKEAGKKIKDKLKDNPPKKDEPDSNPSRGQ